MGIGDFLGKAKEKLSGHEDQAEDAVEKARHAVKDKTPDQADAVVDKAADQAQGFIRKDEA
jgi:hypothetical protein